MSIQKSVLSTSFRCDTHATDSTCMGWSAKSAATQALRPTAPVVAMKTAYSRTALAACSAAFSSR